jgi:hypothetical protein
MSDIHIGAFFRDPVLRDLNLRAFITALDKCVEEKIDFIIISGDLFETPLPDIKILNQAVKKMKETKDEGIEIYVIYGSHDYSPTETSIIDVLQNAGLFKKAVDAKIVDGKLKLNFVVDAKTGAKIAGMSARKLGIEKKYYEILELESLEKEKGFKIFAFHSAISEFKPKIFAEMESIPLSQFPKNFAYYAGGHVHAKFIKDVEKYGTIAYPRVLFGSDYRDLESNAEGAECGFFVIEFDDKKIINKKYVPIKICDAEMIEYTADNKTSLQVQKGLKDVVDKLDPKNKIVLFKIKGELSAGKPSDIDFAKLRETIMQKGAVATYISRYSLVSKEFEEIKILGETREEIESKLFKENIGKFKIDNKKLAGEPGVKLSLKLLNALKEEETVGETKTDYQRRIVDRGFEIMELKG